MGIIFEKVSGEGMGGNRPKGKRKESKNYVKFEFDDEYQYTVHWLLFYEFKVLLRSFLHPLLILVWSMIGLSICKYEPFWHEESLILTESLSPVI